MLSRILDAYIIIITIAIYIALTLKINYEPKTRKFIFTEIFLILFPMDGTLNIAFLYLRAVHLRCLSYLSEQKL